MNMNGISEKKITKILESFIFPRVEYKPIDKNYDDPKYQNYNVCRSCMGQCCKIISCPYSPDDFESMQFNYLVNRLRKGDISIALIDKEQVYKDTDCFYLRPRLRGRPVVDIGFSKRVGTCIHLTATGCDLTYEERPTGGRLLIPEADMKKQCLSDYGPNDVYREWLPFKKVIARIIENEIFEPNY